MLERYSPTPDPGGYFNSASTYNALNFVIGSTGNPGAIRAGFSGAVRNQYYAVYIDYNRNGSFSDAGELVAGQSSITSTNDYTFTVNIPATATPGITAVRVVMQRQPTAVSPCLTGNRGETEDYYINLTTTALVALENNPTGRSAEMRAENGITVSPNPSSGRYNINLPHSFSPDEFEILSAGGMLIKKGSLMPSKQFPVDISTMPSGIYLLRLHDKQGRNEMVKLVKN
jgi:hypothetical protein